MNTKNKIIVILLTLLVLMSCENKQYEDQFLIKGQDENIEDIGYLKLRKECNLLEMSVG